MTPAMYFGIRYAVRHVDADPDLAGLLITGTGDVFAPGGDMGGGDGSDNWMTFGSALGMDVTPFETLRQSVKPVVSAVNGLCQGGGLQIALCSDMAVVSERATFRVPELFRGIADTYYSQMLARLIGPVRTRDLMFTGRTLTAARGRAVGHGRARGPARGAARRGARGTRPVLPDGTGGAQPWSSPAWTTTWACSTASACRPALVARSARRLPGVQGAPLPGLGASGAADRRADLTVAPLRSEIDAVACTGAGVETAAVL